MRGTIKRQLSAFFAVLASSGFLISLSLPVRSAPADAARDSYQPRSLVGSYLAGRLAQNNNDLESAARFYGSALLRDPDSKILLDQAFTTELMNGSFSRAEHLAERLIKARPKHRMAQLFLGVVAFNQQQHAKAEQHFQAAAIGPIGELTSALALAWSKLAAGESKAAFDKLELQNNADWAQYYLTYHRALMSDVAGQKSVASAAFRQVFLRDGRTLRTALAYARHAAHSGKPSLAKSIIKKHLTSSDGDAHALVRDLLRQLDGKEPIARLVDTTKQGMIEVFYGLGEALAGEGGLTPGMLYLQIALYLEPRHPFALAALASAFESTQRYAKAIETYNRIPKNTALETAIDIRKALNLNSLDRVAEARTTLQGLLSEQDTVDSQEKSKAREDDLLKAGPGPGDVLTVGSRRPAVKIVQQALADLGYDIGPVDGAFGPSTRNAVLAFQKANRLGVDGRVGTETYKALIQSAGPLSYDDGDFDKADKLLVLDAMGNILRARKRYVEAIGYYDQAIALIKKPRARDWTYYYSRGTCHERSKNWPAAERDLKFALKLMPDQPLVLNYLGYSWIDQGINLKEGLKLIEKAVALKPDDGYIVDSLGWAHFKLGNVEQAVLFLERAVELRPDDPILNDHLGDALWRAGRQREARFQWEQALTLSPEPEDLEKIKSKLKTGLLVPVEAQTAQKEKSVSSAAPAKEVPN